MKEGRRDGDSHCMNPATKELLPGIEEGSMYATEVLDLPNTVEEDSHSYIHAAMPLLSPLTRVLFYHLEIFKIKHMKHSRTSYKLVPCTGKKLSNPAASPSTFSKPKTVTVVS